MKAPTCWARSCTKRCSGRGEQGSQRGAPPIWKPQLIESTRIRKIHGIRGGYGAVASPPGPVPGPPPCPEPTDAWALNLMLLLPGSDRKLMLGQRLCVRGSLRSMAVVGLHFV